MGKRGVIVVNRKIIVSTVLFLLAFALFVYATGHEAVNHLAVSSINITSMSKVPGSLNIFTPAGAGTTRVNNVSGTLSNITIFFDKSGGTNNKITNVSVMWVLRSNNSIMRNDTLSNVSGTTSCPATINCNNMSGLNFSVDTTSLPDGAYNLTLFIYNFSEGPSTINVTNTTMVLNLTVDNTPPIISNLSLNFTNGTNFTGAGWLGVGVLARDVTTYIKNITFVLIHVYNGTRYNFTGNDTGVANTLNRTIDFSTLVEGLYDIQVFSNDTVNNVNNSERNVSFRVDKTSPNVTAMSADGKQDRNFTTTAGVLITLNASINDSVTGIRLANFSFDLNGTQFNLSATVTEGRFNLSINSSQLSEGRHTIRGIAKDSLGNENRTETFQIRVDSTVPQLNNLTLSVVNGSNQSETSTVVINISANDSITVPNGVIFEIVGLHNTTRFNITLTASSSPDGPQGAMWSTSMSLSAFTDGVYDVRAYANDTLNNVNVSLSIQNVSFRADVTVPNVTGLSADGKQDRNFTTTAGVLITLNASINDSVIGSGLRIANFSFELNGTDFNRSATITEGRFNLSINSSQLSEGRHTIRVRAVDGVGHVNRTETFQIRVDSTVPQLNNFTMNVTNGTNFTASGVIKFNISMNDSITVPNGVIFEIVGRRNASRFNITVAASSSPDGPQGAMWTTDVPLSTLTDGVYDVKAYANDTLNNVNVTLSLNGTTFRVDTTPPNATNAKMNNFSDGINLSAGLSEDTRIFNLTSNDSMTGIRYVNISISNGTTAPINVSLSFNDARWNSTYNISRLTEGHHNVTAYAVDSLGHVNNSFIMAFTIDRSAPTVTVTCTPQNPTTGQTVTCSCSGVDSVSGIKTSAQFTTGGTSESTTASGTGTFTSSTCRATDFADNIGSDTDSWTVTAATSGGGSAGGSGGGSSSGITGQFEKVVWTSINAGEEATVPVDNGKIGVTEVSFTAADKTYGAWLKVEAKVGLPSSITAVDTQVYKIFEITHTNVEEVLKDAATIKFKVEKQWLSENKLKKEDAALFRNTEGKWLELAATVLSEDESYVYYSSKTPGFSYFVIGQRKQAVATPPPAAPSAPVTGAVVEAPAASEEVPVEAPAPVAKAEEGKAMVWAVPLVVAIVLAVLLYLYWRRGK